MNSYMTGHLRHAILLMNVSMLIRRKFCFDHQSVSWLMYVYVLPTNFQPILNKLKIVR